MTAFERGCRLRIASKSLAVVLSATLTASCLAGQTEPDASGTAFKISAVADEPALGPANERSDRGPAEYAKPHRLAEMERHAPARNIERTMSEALSPPRQRCAAINAAISQAVMDKHGSRALAPAPNAGRYPGSANWATGPKDGQFADKQARLEAEYSNLDCARSAR